MIPIAMTIAGSDSGGGAGIQADLKTFSAMGVHGAVVITSVTAQNTLGIKGIHDLPPEFVKLQIETVMEDLEVKAIKTGMLSNSEIIEVVSSSLESARAPIVVDPVMVAESGGTLLERNALDTLLEKLLPMAKIVTPNRMEAEKLSGIKISSIEDAKKAAKLISKKTGIEAVLVKGGHLESKGKGERGENSSESIDVLYHEGEFREYSSKRISGDFHGTGCSFSAAITSGLAKGFSLEESVRIAKEFINLAMKFSRKVGKGLLLVNPSAWVDLPAEKWKVYRKIEEGLGILEEVEGIHELIPEVGSNLVMALPREYCMNVGDVAGVLGRISTLGSKIKACGPIRFGASKHLAKAVLKAMEYDSEMRASINIRYSPEIVKIAREIGFSISNYDRREEPPEIKLKEGESIPWGIKIAIEKLGKVPDLIYHEGDFGKEPMVNIFGRDAIEVVNKLLLIHEKIRSKKNG